MSLIDEKAFLLVAITSKTEYRKEMYDFVEAYELAKLENQKAAYIDDREPSLPNWKHDTNCKHTADAKPALPELPLPWLIPEKWSIGDTANNYAHILKQQNQLITCLEAVYKELEGRG